MLLLTKAKPYKIIHRKSLKDRALGVWKQYIEVKHGIVGMVFVLIFIIIAFSAPILFPIYPGELARVGPNYAAPEWTIFTDPDAPPKKNYIPDPYFEDDAAWNFSSIDAYTGLEDDHGSYTYDTTEYTAGTRSVKFTLNDDSNTSSFRTNVKANTSFHYGYSTPTWVIVSFKLKSRVNGTLEPRCVSPYFRLQMPPDNPLGPMSDYISKFPISPAFPAEWRKYTRNVTYLAYYYIFRPNSTVKAEIGLEFNLLNQIASQTGTAEFWFDELQIVCLPNFWGPLGTTNKGQDVMAQLFWGAQVSLYVGLIATFSGVAVGLIVGLLSGYFGGYIDEILMRIVDFFLIMPTLPILMVLAAMFQPSLEVTTVIIALFAWPGPSRIIRSQVLVEKEKSYVEAAKAAGAGDVYLIFKHVLPNVLTLVFVQMATGVSAAILNEAALSFLGLTPVDLVSWGRMLQESYISGALNIGAWWFVIPPGITIVMLSMGFVFIGYAVDKAMNPRQRKL